MVTPPRTLEEQAVGILSREKLWLVTAESCTGGLIAHRITNVAGASECFLGGIVAYSNALKMALLGVSPGTLAGVGAVSEEVAREMAEGARDRYRADVSLAVTGIAGPGGGSPGKPVGLVYIAVAWPGGCDVVRAKFTGKRSDIKQQTADTALNILWERIQ
ncbi:MAG TPA: CinA family protein [Candidatus Hydrogenedentes bacterium]|nr:CinA family protein [Candidatus Hydrogenedentota bacterium]HQE83665.1 CinA family protein [Candidatus Hydrogenedentota bacterium]HQH52159.1 CinA family protein [Candidatus Hydrogenedentota bacterium]HQM50087.1 CinA family protein [Candidatus Hydrogenedentota bacterium]